MAMAAADIERMIKESFPDASVSIDDLACDGDHYAATVVTESFRGPRAQHTSTSEGQCDPRPGDVRHSVLRSRKHLHEGLLTGVVSKGRVPCGTARLLYGA